MKVRDGTKAAGDSAGAPSEAKILRWLRGQESIPPFRIKVLAGNRPRDRAVDAIVKLSFGKVERKFAVEVRSKASARALREAATEIRATAPAGTFPLIVCTYLPTEMARQLLEQGVSAVDLCGNMSVVVPGTWYVERLGAPNRFPDTRLVKNVFRGSSSLIPRVLVSGESYASATDLLAAMEARGGSTSLPTVSRVLRQLEDEAVVTRSPDIRAIDFDRLLRLFVANYRPAATRAQVTGRSADLDSVRTKMAETASRKGLRLVGVAPERHVNFPSSYEELVVYTTSADELLEGISLRSDSPFQNVVVYETDDQSVFFDAREEDGFIWTSPLEEYLRLATGDDRMRAMAKELRPMFLA